MTTPRRGSETYWFEQALKARGARERFRHALDAARDAFLMIRQAAQYGDDPVDRVTELADAAIDALDYERMLDSRSKGSPKRDVAAG